MFKKAHMHAHKTTMIQSEISIQACWVHGTLYTNSKYQANMIMFLRDHAQYFYPMRCAAINILRQASSEHKDCGMLNYVQVSSLCKYV